MTTIQKLLSRLLPTIDLQDNELTDAVLVRTLGDNIVFITPSYYHNNPKYHKSYDTLSGIHLTAKDLSGEVLLDTVFTFDDHLLDSTNQPTDISPKLYISLNNHDRTPWFFEAPPLKKLVEMSEAIKSITRKFDEAITCI